MNREIKRMVYDAGSRPACEGTRMEAASMIATMSAPRAREDMEAYLEELPRQRAPSDRDIVRAWEKMLAA